MFELTCITLSMLVYVMYISIVCFKYGVPDCISRTYYLLGDKFTYWLIAVAFLLFPAWVSISGEDYLFLTFLSVVFLVGVGIVPKYLDNLRILHLICVGITLTTSLIWNFMIGIYTIPIALGIIALGLLISRIKNKVFYMENLAFANIYISALTELLN